MTDLATTSPAYNRTRIDGINSLDELAWCGKINLRGDIDNKKFASAVESALGVSLPDEANTHHSNGSITVYWLGPNEWLCHCSLPETSNLLNQLRSDTSDLHCAYVDVTDYFTVLRLDGPDSDKLLAKACPLDLHPSVFKEDQCTQTRFGHASILLHKLSDTPSFNIQVRWSYTEYVWDYLVSAMQTIENKS